MAVTHGLAERVLDELAEAGLPGRTGDLVLAAVLGAGELSAAVAGEDLPPPRPASETSEAAPLAATFLESVTVQGFRGVAGTAKLMLVPGPGLTLVVGRNGSGKSSFADGAELALTGTTRRWEGRAKVWQEGWANLHHDGPRSVEARLAVEGQAGHTVVRRIWNRDDPLSGGTATAQKPGAGAAPLASLGLDTVLSLYRPFLPYSELAGLLEEGPSKLYDAISGVLGLDEVVLAVERISAARKSAETVVKQTRQRRSEVDAALSAVAEDSRADEARALLKNSVPDLDALEALATGHDKPDSDLARLEALTRVTAPSGADVQAAVAELRAARAEHSRLTHSDAGRARELAELLEVALRTCDTGDCPVCGTPSAIDDHWAERTGAAVTRLREEARLADDAVSRLEAAENRCRVLRSAVAAIPAVPGVDTALAAAAQAVWTSAEIDTLEAALPPLAEALDALRSDAAAELERRMDRWKPAALALAAWLPLAREAGRLDPVVKELKAAATWLDAFAGRLRDERFAPIAGHVQRIWESLRHDSNVRIDAVELTGRGNQRRVQLRVSVDGTEGAALAVMSQGELHALALSLFLPRATLPASPFRFLVVDDPVQAMDAARVDGLARALADVASTHQVVVFTHDERLPEACRRLGLGSRVLEVSRGDRSELSIRVRSDPVEMYLDDARAVIRTEAYPEPARRRVVPGLCRNAVEAACTAVVRSRRILAGDAHADVEQLLEVNTKLVPRLALAFFDDAGRAGEVFGHVSAKLGRSAAETVLALNRGVHELLDTNPELIVNEAQRIARAVAALK